METATDRDIDDIELDAIEPEAEAPEIVSDEVDSVADQAEPEDESEAEDEVIVSIGEEAPPPEEQQPAPAWVKELRRANREKERRIRELEAKLNATSTENKPVQVGPKPKLEEHDYDTDKFEAALESWYERKRKADEQVQQQKLAEKAQQDAWQARLDGYSKARAELRVKDFEDAESTAQEVLNVTQQGIVVQGADNPALVIYALGKNPKKAAEIAAIDDPVKFAFAVAKLEKELRVSNRRAAPPPERTITGNGRVSGAVDSTLERLRAEAEKTGDFTKVLQYRRQKKAAQRN